VPFVKVSRDKRGYEQIALVHVSARRGKPSKARVLYVFRTPPGVKIGREPFDQAVQRELEAQNPGIVFDWKALSNIPIPAPDVEFWRERRKADKALKLARHAEEQAGLSEEPGSSELSAAPPAVPADLAAASPDPSGVAHFDTVATGDFVDVEGGGEPVPATPDILASENARVDPRPSGQRRRQRRSGRRRHSGGRPELPFGVQDQGLQPVQASPPSSGDAGTIDGSTGAGSSEEAPPKVAADASKEA
jgi:hypothetical protein